MKRWLVFLMTIAVLGGIIAGGCGEKAEEGGGGETPATNEGGGGS